MCIATADKRVKNTHAHKEDVRPSARGAWLLSEGLVCTESCPGMVALCVRLLLSTQIISNLAKLVLCMSRQCLSTRAPERRAGIGRAVSSSLRDTGGERSMEMPGL